MPESLWFWPLELDLPLSSQLPLMSLALRRLLRSVLGDLLFAGYILLVDLLLRAGVLSLCLGGENLGEKGRLEVLAENEDEGMLKGHDDCAKYLDKAVGELLLYPADLDTAAHNALLREVGPVFMAKDNEMLVKAPIRMK